MGTGAFTSVSADRGVQVSVADDNAALLQIGKARGTDGVTDNAAEYVTVSDGVVSLDFSGTDAGATGINDNATTVIDDLLQITNQGTQTVVFGYTHPASPNGNFAIYHEDQDLDELGDPTNDGQLNIDTATELSDLPKLEPGDTVNNIGVYFFGSPDASGISDGDITFKAEAVSDVDSLEDL